MAQRVTIKSIAQDLGISHMTVSRALSNHPNVREETRKTVIDRARKLGYVKSIAASAMRGEATGIIGLLLPNIVNEFYARFANALTLACEDFGIQVITHLTNDDLLSETHALMRLRNVQADSVVMVPAPGEPDAETARHLADLDVVQLVRRRASMPKSATLLLADAPSLTRAVHHLAARGHQRIAYIGGHSALSSGHERYGAFRKGMAETGLDLVTELVHREPPSFDMGKHCSARILDAGMGATALVCGGFEISNGALETCLRRGIAFPEELAFVGYGDPAFYEWIQGGISTISLPVDDLAQTTADLVSHGKSGKYPSITIPAHLLIRASS